MNILQVIPELDAGGAERTTIEIAEAVDKAGGQCWVASEGGRLVPELKKHAGRFITFRAKSKNPWVMFSNVYHLISIIIRNKIQIVHARSRAPAWSALIAARLTRTAFVTTYHGTYKAQSALKRKYNAIMASGDIVIANSRFIGNHVLGQHRIARQRLRIIPRGIDCVAFDPVRISIQRRDIIRKKWGLNEDDTVILLPGRLTEWKGQDFFLDVMANFGNNPNLNYAT